MRPFTLLAGEKIDDRGGATAVAFLSVGQGTTLSINDGEAIAIPTPCVWPGPQRDRGLHRVRITGPCTVLLCETPYEAENVRVAGLPGAGINIGAPLASLDGTTGTPVAGKRQVINLGAGDQSVDTVAGQVLLLTVIGGDCRFAIDADASQAVNQVPLLSGAGIYVRAGAKLHAVQGDDVGGVLHVNPIA